MMTAIEEKIHFALEEVEAIQRALDRLKTGLQNALRIGLEKVDKERE